jgi:hypothetical protein
MTLRDWSGSRLILTWIWSSLLLGLTETIADALGHPLTTTTSNDLRVALFVCLVATRWRWYRLRTRL